MLSFGQPCGGGLSKTAYQDRLHFIHGGHAVEGAEAGATHGGGGVGGAQRLIDRLVVEERVYEAASKDVAGAGGIHGAYVERRLAVEAIAVERDGAAIATGHA